MPIIKKQLTLNLFKALAITCGITIAAFIFCNKKNQGVFWTFPYFSGAANFERILDWQISPSEFEKVAVLSDKEHRSYRYVSTEKTVKHSYNAYGFVLVALSARNLFPFFGDLYSVIVLQTIIHIIISLLVFFWILESLFQRGCFFLFYSINPVILHFVTFPFYYFWTVIPSFLLIVLWYKPNTVRWTPLFSLLLLISILIRPPTLFISSFVLVVCFLIAKERKERRLIKFSIALFLIGVGAVIYLNPKSSPFHTIYVGIGAYTNPYGIAKPVDTEGHRYFRSVVSKSDIDLINKDFRDPEYHRVYNQVLKARVMEIVAESPWLLTRNAALNTIQAFGIGFDVDRAWTRPISIAIGAVVFALFVYTKQWIWGFGILSYAIGFTAFFPPIPAYLFGAYSLTVLGTSDAIKCLKNQPLRKKLRSKSSS